MRRRQHQASSIKHTSELVAVMHNRCADASAFARFSFILLDCLTIVCDLTIGSISMEDKEQGTLLACVVHGVACNEDEVIKAE